MSATAAGGRLASVPNRIAALCASHWPKYSMMISESADLDIISETFQMGYIFKPNNSLLWLVEI